MFVAFLLNLFFSAFELVGGIFTNSISIISDAIHDLGDSVSIGASLLLEHKSGKKPNEKYTYGYLRYSVFGAFLTSTILLLGSALVIYRSIYRFISPVEVHYDGMLIFSVLGIAINGLAAMKTAHGSSLNEKTLSLHMLEDVLGWAAILIGSIVIKFTHWYWIDPVLSLLIALFVLYHAFSHMRQVLMIVMEKTPSEISIPELMQELRQVDKVKDVHHVHLWSMDGRVNCGSIHALVEEGTTAEEFENAKRDLRHILDNHSIAHATIEMEYVHCGHTECDAAQNDTHEHCHHGHHH